jgi:hypothetical protein
MQRVLVLSLLVVAGCDESLGSRERVDGEVTADAGVVADGGGALACFEDGLTSAAMMETIDEAVAAGGCSTAVVRPLSEQLIAEILCLRPGSMARIDDIPGLSLGAAASVWLQAPAAAALRDAVVEGGGGLSLNSTLRTLPQQLMLYRWYTRGECGITLAASPGTSPHESGLAIDTSDYDAWRTRLEAHGWSWHGAGDLVHFDYVGGGTISLEGESVLAFQRLWNRNHPEDLLAEDGDYGPQTEARLRMAPAEGFPIGASCDDPPPPPFSVDWARDASGVYVLTADAASEAVTVEYLADGRSLGTAPRGPGGGFALVAGTCALGGDHEIEAIARDAGGAEVSRGVGLLFATGAEAIGIRPRAEATWEIVLERPDVGVVAIEVEVDGTLLTDETSGAARSTRLAVRHAFSLLGARSFVVRTYDAAGTVVSTHETAFTLR